jgi:hypothetical protein
MRLLVGNYDAAILDLPYNLCSKLSDEQLQQLLISARGFTRRAVIISTEQIDTQVRDAGFMVMDRCEVRKGAFTREVLVCQ